MKENFFEKRQIYYRQNDYKPERKTILFVHGVSGSSSAWVKYEESLKNEYNIISLDLRGHGKSKKPSEYEDYKIELFADDIYELIKFLNIDKVVIVSHSFGSIVALSFIENHKEMVEGVILISPQSNVKDMFSAKIVKPFIDLLTRFFPRSKKSTAGTHIDYSKYLNSGDWNVRRSYADIRNTGLKTYLYSTKQTFEFNGQSALESIEVPTLIIHGELDSIFPLKYAEKIKSEIKNSKITVIKNSDHILVLNNFNEVSKLIKGFIDKLD